MEKVKLPLEVAEAIDILRKDGYNDFGIVGLVTCISLREEYDSMAKFAKSNTKEFLKALAIGYEVEETPEDKLREYFTQQQNLHSDLQDGSEIVIQTVLDYLNIKIEGVNA